MSSFSFAFSRDPTFFVVMSTPSVYNSRLLNLISFGPHLFRHVDDACCVQLSSFAFDLFSSYFCFPSSGSSFQQPFIALFCRATFVFSHFFRILRDSNLHFLRRSNRSGDYFGIGLSLGLPKDLSDGFASPSVIHPRLSSRRPRAGDFLSI